MLVPPLTATELNLDWLNKTLEPKFKATVAEFSADNIGAGVGVLSDVARVNLKYKQQTKAPTSIVAKFSAASPEAQTIASDFNFYEVESMFYKEIEPVIPVSVPKCIYNYFDADKGMTILMSDIKGVALDQIAGCTLEQALSAVETMAQMHSWAYNNVSTKFPWLRKTSDTKVLTSMRNLITILEPLVTQNVGKLLPAWLKDIVVKVPDFAEKQAHKFTKYPETLLHGDFRADNLIFNDDQLVILDWQIALRGNGTYDLGMFLSQSIDTELRRAHLDTILNRYLEVMEENKVEVNKDDFHYLFRLCIAGCLINPLFISGMIDDSIPRTRQLAETMLTRACRTVEDLDCFEFLSDN